MHKGKKSVSRNLFIIFGLFMASIWGQQPAWADCHFTNPDANPTITFAMPTQIVIEPDTAVGSVVYSGETTGESHGLTRESNIQAYEGYTVFTASDSSGVLEGVYKTSVPGIGFRAARSDTTTATFTSGNIITLWHYLGIIRNWDSYDSTYHIAVQLVVIGAVQSGTLDTSQFNAEYQMGSLTAAKLRFTPTTVKVIANTCDLISKNINVLMDTVSASELSQGFSRVLTDDSFKIEIANCTAGTQIDYKFTSAGSTGVTGGNILNIAQGEGAASGVGIQLLDKNNNVLNFDQEYNGIASTAGEQTEVISLKARYAKTGNVKGGQVDAVATFEIYYR